MKIIQKVLIKQIITENSKQKLHKHFYDTKMQLDQECQQLLFEQRKLQNKHGISKQEVAHRFRQEVKKRKEKMKLLDFKIEQLDMLESGSEIVEKEVEAIVDVNIGSHWDEMMGEKAIILKDGVVIRIDK
ncbi:YlqD family protein [Virgibacillus sp. W0181]|uniref:YlqD family protein n=1 Tax=Virgibacillus sp. W0181 TaxID=3391581 RepID=UPI003F468820